MQTTYCNAQQELRRNSEWSSSRCVQSQFNHVNRFSQIETWLNLYCPHCGLHHSDLSVAFVAHIIWTYIFYIKNKFSIWKSSWINNKLRHIISARIISSILIQHFISILTERFQHWTANSVQVKVLEHIFPKTVTS